MELTGEIFDWFMFGFAIVWLIIRPLSVPISAMFTKGKTNEDVYIEGVSMLVPCHNEEENLEKAVESLLKQTVNKQIILIENGSSDKTYEVAKMLERKYPEVVATTVNVPKGQFPISVAMNHGLKLVKYPYMVRLDADTQLKDSNTIYNAVKPIALGEAVATACNVRLSNTKQSMITRAQSIEYYLSMEMDRRSQKIYNGILVASGAMQCLKTDIVKKVGGYILHPWTSEDMDITLKMHDYGKVEMVPDAIGYTDAPDNWKVLIKQRYWWAILGAMCMITHRRSIGRRVGYKGCLGLISLPLKLISSLQAIIGMVIKGYLMARMALWNNIDSLLISYSIMTAIHLAVDWFAMLVVAPVAKEKQGLGQWWIIPFFALLYQPIMGFVRLFAVIGTLKVIIKYRSQATTYVSKQFKEVA